MDDFLNYVKGIFDRSRGLFTLGFATIVSNGIGGLFWLYIASLLGTEDYGRVSYFISIAIITSTISLAGMSNTMVVFRAKGEKIQSLFFVITIIPSIVGSVILFLMFENFGMSIYAIGFVIFTLVISDMLGKKVYANYAKSLVIQRIIMVSIAIPFYFIFGADGVLIGIALSFLPFIIIVYKNFRQSINFSFLNSKPPFERPPITLSFTTIHFSWISSSVKSKINGEGSISLNDITFSEIADAEKNAKNTNSGYKFKGFG